MYECIAPGNQDFDHQYCEDRRLIDKFLDQQVPLGHGEKLHLMSLFHSKLSYLYSDRAEFLTIIDPAVSGIFSAWADFNSRDCTFIQGECNKWYAAGNEKNYDEEDDVPICSRPSYGKDNPHA